MKYLQFAVLLCLGLTVVSGLRESDLKEQDLHEIIFNLENKPIALDFNWMSSIDKWYVPAWSKLHSYRVSGDILKKHNVSEEELTTSCLLFNQDGSIDAFGKTADFSVKTDPHSIAFSLPWKRMKSRFAFRLTDNKSFIFGISSWMDGQISWAIISTEPSLGEESKQRISDYMKAMGLDENMGVTNIYENCQQGTHRSVGTKNEL